jgi:hypothetical protein
VCVIPLHTLGIQYCVHVFEVLAMSLFTIVYLTLGMYILRHPALRNSECHLFITEPIENCRSDMADFVVFGGSFWIYICTKRKVRI